VILCHQHQKLVILRLRLRTCFCRCCCWFSSTPNQKRVISTEGGALCRRSGETPAFRLRFYRTPSQPRPAEASTSAGCPIHGVVSSLHEWAIARSGIPPLPGARFKKKRLYRSEPSRLNIVPLARSNNQIRLVHLDLNPVVLVWPCVTRNVEGYLILEELTLFIAPIVGPTTIRVGSIGNLYLLRAYSDGPKRRDGLRQVVVEDLEVRLLKIGDTLSGSRRNYNIDMNVSGSRSAFTGALLRRGCRNTKHHHRQNGKYTLADEHKLTPVDVIRSPGPKVQ
jgi:hypothetical protein